MWKGFYITCILLPVYDSLWTSRAPARSRSSYCGSLVAKLSLRPAAINEIQNVASCCLPHTPNMMQSGFRLPWIPTRSSEKVSLPLFVQSLTKKMSYKFWAPFSLVCWCLIIRGVREGQGILRSQLLWADTYKGWLNSWRHPNKNSKISFTYWSNLHWILRIFIYLLFFRLPITHDFDSQRMWSKAPCNVSECKKTRLISLQVAWSINNC